MLGVSLAGLRAALRIVGIVVRTVSLAASARIGWVVVGGAGTTPPPAPVVGIIVRTPTGPIGRIVVGHPLATPSPIGGIAVALRLRAPYTCQRDGRGTAQDRRRPKDEQPA